MINLYYHGGSGNHGCEAIVRGTSKILNTDMILYSMRTEEDRKYGLDTIVTLKDDFVSAIPQNSFKDYICRIHRKIMGNSELKTRIERKKFLRNIEQDDICLSIGGDNYCYAGYETLSDLNFLIKKRGGKTILWGCSVEPDIIDKEAEQDFKRYDLIIARESITYEALKKINSNTKLLPDPAFVLDLQETSLPDNFKEGHTIGINLSPLIMKNETLSGMTQKNYERLIEHILDNTNYNIALIAHVVWEHDNDIKAVEELYNKYKQSGRISKVCEGNAPQLKWVISKCKMFIGARTHATIAAYSTCIPTLVIGYSVKAIGIAKDLFGTEDNYVLPVQSLKTESDILMAFKWLDLNCDRIKKHLEDFIPQYCEKAFCMKDEVFKLI